MAKKKSNTFLTTGVILIITSLISLALIVATQETALFPEKVSTSGIAPSQTTYTEGETLTIKQTIDRNGNCGSPRILASAIWIDGKKYGCTSTYQLYDNNFAVRNAFVCDTTTIPTRTPTIIEPTWGFNYGNVELSKELTAGSHLVEGWALTNEPQSTFCAEGGASWIDFFRFEIQVKPLPCVFSDNQLLVVESFSSDFSKNDLRFSEDFSKFCSVHPPIIVDKFTKTSFNDLSIHTKLQNNQIVNVDSDKVVSVFYVIDKPESLQVACDPEKAYNIKEEQCQDVIGFVQICSQGYFSPESGTCVVTPEIEYLCPAGGRFDSALGVCIDNKPTQIVCEIGDYNAETDTCQFTPDLDIICPSGTAYDSQVNKCEYFPESSAVCPSGTSFNQLTKKCEFTPEESAVCSSGTSFNQATGKCEFTPETSAICLGNFNFNSNTGKCEFTPSKEIICTLGSYDVSKDLCIYTPDTNIKCRQGSYVKSIDACVYEPSFEIKCEIKTIYDVQEDLCIYKPETATICDLGFTYNSDTENCEKRPKSTLICPEGNFDKDRNACVIKPNIDYLCLNGEITEQFNTETQKTEKVCQIIPEEKIICRTGFKFNSETKRCERLAVEGFNKLLFIPITLGVLGLLSFVVYFIRRKK